MDRAKLESEVERLLAEKGFELVDLKTASHNGKPLLQVFIDKVPGGVTLDECATASRDVGESLDSNNFYEDGYFLEVSSPGIDRIVRKEKDFKRFTGQNVKVRLKQPVNGARVFYGALIGFENGEIELSGGLKFKLADIDEARLHPADEDILRGKSH